jgi:hypothetical protein
MTTPNEHDAKICQRAAEALWQAASSDRTDIANWDSPVYKSLEYAFKTSLRTVYGLKPARATQVSDLLSEYGPDDSLHDTKGRGVASYVEFVLANSARRRF